MIALARDLLAFGAAVARFSGRRGLLAAFLVGLGATLEGIGILLLVPFLGLLFGAGGAPAHSPLAAWVEWLTPGLSAAGRLSAILGLFGLLMILRAITLWQRDVLVGRLQVTFIEAQRVKIARLLAGADWPTLAAMGHARVTHLMGGDIQRCGAGVGFLLQSGAATVILAAQSVLILLLSPLLGALAIAAMAAGTIALSGLVGRSRDAGRMVTEASLAFTQGMARFLGGLKMAMSQHLQHAFVERFAHDVGTSADRQVAFTAQQAMLRALWSLLAAAVAAATMLLGFAVLHLSPAVLIALLVVLSRLGGPALQLHLGFQQIAYSLPAWHAVTAMEGELAAAAAAAADEAGPRFEGPIRLEDVVYRHRGGDGGVEGVTLRLAEGEIVGLSGPSGAGKTTLADLLVGLIAPQSGRIAIGKEVLTPAASSRWQAQIAYVAQDPVMFNDSLRANLAWSNPAADDAAIDAALAIVGADRWAQSLPEGLDTILGEGGALISGGERQRVALARALLRAPSLLVLDEATSALDLAAERAILARIRAMTPRPAILMIAHRPESLRFCDRIVAIDKGRLAPDAAGDPAAPVIVRWPQGAGRQ